jgi:predicted metal-dependent phosphoesterase TrpH
MHLHSRVSHDSLNAYEGLLRTAEERGLDRIVVTDHNRIDGALRLREMDPVRVIVGEEVKTREGADIIGIFLREPIPRGTPARETCERIRTQGGVVYVPHPFDTRRAGGGALLDGIADLVDAVEAHNARTWRRALNEQGERWAVERGFPVGAGSDAHTLRELGRGYVEVPPFENTRESFLAALRAGRVAGRTFSSPLCSLFSTYAKVHKRFAGRD